MNTVPGTYHVESVWLLWQAVCGERLVSGSDDFTLYMWTPGIDQKPLARLTGHMQLVNDVRFSPDTRLLASASFDKSIKLWEGKTGKYVHSADSLIGICLVVRCYTVLILIMSYLSGPFILPS